MLSTFLSEDNNSDGGGSDNNINTWRKLIQQCLSHGTNYDHLVIQPTYADDSAQNNDDANDVENNKIMVKECAAENSANLLVSALEWYLKRWYQQQKKHPDDSTSSCCEQELKNNPVICTVVETIWLVGCLLESDDVGTTTAPAAAESSTKAVAADAEVGGEEKTNEKESIGTSSISIINPKKVAYNCLVSIIRHLVTPNPWMMNIDDEKDEDMAEDIKENDEVKEDDDDKLVMMKDAESEKKLLLPLIPITALQTTLELSLLEASNLLPAVPPTAKKRPSPTKKKKGSAGGTPTVAAEPDTSKEVYIHKKLKKMNTDMYYRQHKFNLLAEESEGYAKLLGYLVLGMKDDDNHYEDDDNIIESGGSSSNSRSSGKDDNNNNNIKYVQELIGAFDLDPNRVLDLVLDTLEWELNEIIVTNTNTTGSGNNNEWWGLDEVRTALTKKCSSSSSSSSSNNNVKGIHSLLAIIRELDGNNSTTTNNGEYEGRAVAHLLGFKYRSYRGMSVATAASATSTATNKGGKDANKAATSSETSTTRNIYPRSLHLSTAFLCAHGVLDPHALLPHLVPAAVAPTKTAASTTKKAEPAAATATSLMQAYQTYTTDTIKRLKKMGVVSLNSSKSDKQGDKSASSESTTLCEALRYDPIIGIFRALLALVNDWDTSVAFLAHAALPNFASLLRSSNDDDESAVDKIRAAMDTAVLAACTMSEGVASDVCAWVNSTIGDVYKEMYPTSGQKEGDNEKLSLLLPRSTDGEGFVIAKDSTLAEMSLTLMAPLSCLVKSGMIRLNQNLYIKLCRLYKHATSSLDDNDADIIDDDTFSVLSTFLVPSLSLFPSDTILPGELWSVLQNLPYTLRYKLYSAWRHPGLEKGTLRSLMPAAVRSGQIPKPLKIIESEIETGIAARYVLKRISKDNIQDTGRQLAKTSHNNPLVVFTDILGKIESYDNMISMMVDTFQFVTRLSLDVMGYCLLFSLGGGDEVGQKNRTRMVGLNTEQWLASLETFTGAFYRKFPDVELKGILFYLTKRFQEGESSELGVLRSLIKTVGGYGFVDYDSTASLSDLQLDGRCGSRLLKRETSSFGVIDDINRKASQHLRSVLQEGDLGVIILILLSQIRSRVLYSKPSDTTKEHVKVIGNKYDDCEAVMCLLLEYLSDSSDDSNAKEKFAASMPSLSELHEMYGVDTSVSWMLCRPLVRKSLFYMDDSKLANKASEGEPPAYLKPFTSSEMTGTYQGLLPESAWKHITPKLFEMFFSLAVYDISCPEERYKVDIDRLKKDCERLVQLQKGGAAAAGQMAVLAAQATAAGGSIAQVRQATAFTETHAAELARLKRNVDQLTKDFQRQQKRCKLVRSKLEALKESLCTASGEGEGSNSSMFAPSFMTFCLYPRCFLSPEDALFCAHFLKLLHKLKMPGFMTIELIDNIVNAVTGSLYCMTEDEAGNCAIFFNEIWKSANSWRYDNDAFASELKDTVSRLLPLASIFH